MLAIALSTHSAFRLLLHIGSKEATNAQRLGQNQRLARNHARFFATPVWVLSSPLQANPSESVGPSVV